jgi:pyroglutamyl-peptidase
MDMPTRAILVTGFEPFAGFGRNPSAEIATQLDGTTIAGCPVIGRTLPVALDGLDAALERALAGIDPLAVVALGLAADEAAIRLERVAVNLADFSIPDNAGLRVSDRKLDPAGPDAHASRLPLRAIRAALLARGIPARLSNTAGTYLCNAAMYRLLTRLPARVPSGFIHLPHLPAEAARLMAEGERDSVPSMALELQVEAVRIALALCLETEPAEHHVTA